MPDPQLGNPDNSPGSKRNSREERNFRSNYYGKVGFKGGADDRKTLDNLLSEDPINITRCAAFAVR